MAFALSNMHIETPAFAAGDAIPMRHSAEGDNLSPALSWQGAPAETSAFAVICHDPDAPLVQNGTYGFVHWVLYNLDADTMHLDEATDLGTTGPNDFGEHGYGGPMPPEGHGTHNYYFWVLALDEPVALPDGLNLPQLLAHVEPHLIGMDRLIGTYER
ncbi:YbhB/YbcL family Raf kinase inhibitor-like protein [Salinisphaera sp. USBA-960]|uniref:YbhB/YbcL family Raf kinase inhibitor-like protein n=1 Tax=Salinisphaera orenii TaxID=856731 RepID=UPI000DBE3F7E|nr:YbhB/YbcL family Raf kinase inhibitor-like protein [Salifodinibacter halophilus]NNC25948.1 YbhB/YbcL family Raf kinase inhibitor-like protein [Salifodinibacter halophilus]